MRPRDINKGLTHERLLELLSYDPETGEFRRKMALCNSVKVGDIAGSIDKNDGYVRILIDGVRYLGHRLAWFFVHGVWPEMLDHKDLNKSNNALNNLRPASNGLNCRNSPVRKDNLLGIKCVRLHETGRYQARIYDGERFKSLGLYDTPEAASHAYKVAATALAGEFARAV